MKQNDYQAKCLDNVSSNRKTRAYYECGTLLLAILNFTFFMKTSLFYENLFRENIKMLRHLLWYPCICYGMQIWALS